MKGRIKQNKDNASIDDIMNSIVGSNIWMVCTVTENSQGAEVSIRESHGGVMIDTIAMLLEQKEIYDLVQKKIARIKLLDKKQSNPPPTNTDIN